MRRHTAGWVQDMAVKETQFPASTRSSGQHFVFSKALVELSVDTSHDPANPRRAFPLFPFDGWTSGNRTVNNLLKGKRDRTSRPGFF